MGKLPHGVQRMHRIGSWNLVYRPIAINKLLTTLYFDRGFGDFAVVKGAAMVEKIVASCNK